MSTVEMRLTGVKNPGRRHLVIESGIEKAHGSLRCTSNTRRTEQSSGREIGKCKT